MVNLLTFEGLFIYMNKKLKELVKHRKLSPPIHLPAETTGSCQIKKMVLQ